jgi:nucleoside-diphosphate-sugar epimerase
VGKTEVETGQFVVVGRAGFIGSHVTHRLLEDVNAVVGMSVFEEYYQRTIKKGDSVQARKHAFLKSRRDARELRSHHRHHRPGWWLRD